MEDQRTTNDPYSRIPDFPALAARLAAHADTLATPGDLDPRWRARIAQDLRDAAGQLRDMRDATARQDAPQTPTGDDPDIAALWARSFHETLAPNALARLLGELGGDAARAARAIRQVSAALASGKVRKPRSLLSYVIVAARNLDATPAPTAAHDAPPAAPRGPIGYAPGMIVIREDDDVDALLKGLGAS